jgi:hypothetical protein
MREQINRSFLRRECRPFCLRDTVLQCRIVHGLICGINADDNRGLRVDFGNGKIRTVLRQTLYRYYRWREQINQKNRQEKKKYTREPCKKQYGTGIISKAASRFYLLFVHVRIIPETLMNGDFLKNNSIKKARHKKLFCFILETKKNFFVPS